MSMFRRVGLLAGLLIACCTAQAQTYTHQVFLDRDQDPATGCTVATAAGTIAGAEARLTATISDYPAGVASLSLATCSGGSFGSESALQGAYPVGYDLGAGGTDVIEFAVAQQALGGSANAEDWTLWFLSTGVDSGAQDLVGPVAAPGVGVLVPPAVPAPAVIPVLDPWALLLLALALGVAMAWAARRYRGLLPVLLVGAALSLTGIAWAAGYLLDGQVGDWDTAPLASDPAGDTGPADAGADLRDVFAARESGRVFFRADVAEAQIERLITGLIATSFSVDENAADATVVGVLPTASTGLAGLLQFQLLSQAPAGAFALDAAGTLVVADGSLLDAEAAASHALDVSVSINGVPALTVTVAVTVAVNDVNEAPLVADQAFAVDESSASATLVGTLVASDPDGDALAFTLASGNTDGAFALDPASGALSVANQAAIIPANSPFTLAVDVSDGGLTAAATVTVTVNDLNFPPSAGSPVYGTDEDTPLSEPAPGLLAGSSDPDGDTLAVVTTPVAAPAHGSLVLNADGSFTYTPEPDYTGTDAFTYTISDGNGGDVDATANLTVNPVADAPVGVADGYTLDEGATLAPAAPGVLGNDTDAEGDALTAVLDSAPLHASSFTLNADGSFSYTHDGGEDTSDSFSYHANDGGLDSATTVVALTITGINDLPVAVDDAYALAEGGTLTVFSVLNNDTDAEGDALTAVLVSGPAHASAFTLNADGSFDYTHDGSETTSDSFTYTANDAGASNTATVTLTITATNDAPVANDDGYAVDEGATLNVPATGVLGNDTDVEADPLSAQLVAAPANAASFSLNADGSFSYTHDGSETTSDSFTYTANDADPSNTATVTITVNPVNDAPLAVADTASVDEDQPLAVAAPGVLGNDSDAEGDALSAVLDAGPSNAASFSLNADGSYSYTPAADFSGSDSFSYHAHDGSLDSPSVVVSITVNAVNDVPTAAADAYAVNEGSTLAVPATGVLGNDTDPENDPLSAVLVSGPAHAAAFTLNADGSFSYTHDGSETPATDSFSYTANDAGASNVATVTISISAVNDAPVAAADAYAVDEGSVLAIAAPGVLANDSDVEGDAFTAVLVAGPAHASSFALNADGSFNYAHDGSETTSDSFSYQASDADPSNIATVSITINPVNDAPAAATDSAAVDEDQVLTVGAPGVLGNDTDPEGDSLSAVLDAGPANAASFSLNADGSYSYTPAANFNGSDGFSYHAFDGTGASGSVAVTITVAAVDDPPVAMADAATLAEDAPATAIAVLANDTDIDGGPMTIASATDPANGSVAVAGDGLSLAYTPDANYCNSPDATPSATPDSFAYTLAGGSSATVAVTVTCVNDAPTVSGTASASAHTHIAIAVPDGAFDLYAQFAPSDVDGPTPVVIGGTVPTSSAQGGEVSIDTATGAFSYNPPANFTGTDSFGVQFCDSDPAPACSAPQTVTLTVSGPEIWFVDDDAVFAGTADGTLAQPFATLAAAAAAATESGNRIFLHGGGYAGGITLADGVRLYGHAAGSALPGDDEFHEVLGITPASFSVALPLVDQAAPTVTAAAGSAAITLGSGNSLDGLAVQTGAATATGLAGQGFGVLAVDEVAVAGSGTALDLDAGTLNGSFSSVSSSGGANNVKLAGVAGTVDLGGGSLSGASEFGLLITLSPTSLASSTVSLSYAGSISNATAAARVVNIEYHHTGTVTLSGAITETAGDGAFFGDADGAYALTGVVTLQGSLGLVVSVGSTGSISIPNAASAISNPGSHAVWVVNSAPTLAYAGTITKTNNNSTAIRMENNTGGTITLSGATKTLSTGTANAVHLVNNAGTTINITGGGLDIDTTSGIGVNVTGPGPAASTGGTVAITGSGNRITSVSGTALNVAHATIGAAGLTFERIDAGNNTAAADPVNGIVLNNTGAGRLVVTGSGSAVQGGDGSGGLIQNTSGHGIALATTTHPSFTNLSISNTAGSGISGTGVAGFTFANGSIGNSGTGGAADESNIAFNDSLSAANVSGEVTVTGSLLSNARFHGVDIQHHTGTITHANISGNAFTSAASVATSLGSAIRLDAYGSAATVGNVLRATLSNNSITNFPTGTGIHAFGGNSSGTGPSGTFGVTGSATDLISVTGNTMHGGSLGLGNQPDRFFTGGVTGLGQGNFDISDNGTSASPITNIDGVVIELNQFGSGTMSAIVDNNWIAANNAVGSSGINVGCDADGTAAADNAVVSATISNNNVSLTDGPGIFPIARGSTCSLTVRVLDNTVAAPDTTASARAGIRVDSGSSVGDTSVCLELSGNTTGGSTNTGTGSTSPGINLRKQGTLDSVNAFGIEGLTPSPTGSPNVENHVNGLNTSTSGSFGTGGTALLSATSGFTSCNAP